MPNLNMNGPCTLTRDEIDSAVEKKSIGNYALGYLGRGKVFFVQYIGRSESDLNASLKKWVGKYKHFKFSHAPFPRAAFEKECCNYHDLGESEKLRNNAHPKRTEGTYWRCPACNIFDNYGSVYARMDTRKIVIIEER